MFAKHPLDAKKEKLSKSEVLDALRTAIIAELDAVSFYLQIASAADDERIRRVFEDVAREEKTHVGEFLALLNMLDPEQARELQKGFEEARELAGAAGSIGSPNSGGNEASYASDSGGFEDRVVEGFVKAVEGARVLRKILPVTVVGEGLDYIVAERVPTGVISEPPSEHVIGLTEVSLELKLPQRLVARYERLGVREYPLVRRAAFAFADREEQVLLRQLLGHRNLTAVGLSDWSSPDNIVFDVSRAISVIEEKGVRGPYALLVPSRLYPYMLAVSGRAGVPVVEIIERLARIVRHPRLEDDRVILLPLDPSIADIVVGVDTRVDYIGLEDGNHVFRAWETIALRISCPECIVVMHRGERG